jgi:hypothetical protein
MMIQDRSIAEEVLPTLPELLEEVEELEPSVKPATAGGTTPAH